MANTTIAQKVKKFLRESQAECHEILTGTHTLRLHPRDAAKLYNICRPTAEHCLGVEMPMVYNGRPYLFCGFLIMPSILIGRGKMQLEMATPQEESILHDLLR